jgi:hypothetical protein
MVIDSPGGPTALRSRIDTLKVVKLRSKHDRSETAPQGRRTGDRSLSYLSKLPYLHGIVR